MSKKIGFWIAVLFLVLACVSIALFFVIKDKPVYSNEMIGAVSKSFKADLKVFLTTARQSVNQLKRDAKTVDIDKLPTDSLSSYLSKFIENEKYLQGVIIFGDDKGYVIYKDEKTWITTHNMHTDSLIKWKRLDNTLKETGSWFDTYNFFMAQKDLDILKVANLKPGEYIWRTAQSQSQTPQEKDLFFNIFLLNNDSGTDHVALMYKTNELGNRFSRVLNFENPLVTILTERNNIVTPIRTDDTNKIKRYNQIIPQVEIAFQEWQKTRPDTSFTMSFVAFNTEFWIGLDTITPILGAHGYAVTISQHDLAENKKKLDEIYFYLAIIFLIFSLASFLPVYRKHQKSTSKNSVDLGLLTNQDVVELISKGETELVEFKSSLRWDFREEKPNKVLEDVILKSIAAFSNAKGGTLFIGVTDDLEIIGLENDFKTLKKQDVDYFELHLRKLINNQYGIRFSNKHILMQFPDLDGKVICVIHIAAGDTPVYLKTKNKQGQAVEKFYVRSGNASQEITSLKEINEYVAGHFKTGR